MRIHGLDNFSQILIRVRLGKSKDVSTNLGSRYANVVSTNVISTYAWL